MERPGIIISTVYFCFGLIYYAIAAMIFQQRSGEEVSNGLSAIMYAFSDLFFWMTVHQYFLLSIMLSAVAGSVISYFKKQMGIFRVFVSVILVEIALVFLLLLFSSI